jgi:hypothetical protein
MANTAARFGPGRRMALLIERRPRLFPFVVSVAVARIVLSVLAATEERNDLLSLLITLVLVAEVVMVWRALRRVRGRPPTGPGRGSPRVDRLLVLVERFGAFAVYLTTAACLVGYALLRRHHVRPTAILDAISAVRWVQLLVLVGVLALARRWEVGTAPGSGGGGVPSGGGSGRRER